MENNNQFDESLIRYLFNEETAEEKAFIENWLNTSEENRRYFNRLRKTSQLTEVKQYLKYITDEGNLEVKWNRLEQNIAEKEAQIIPINQPEASGDKYQEEIGLKRKPLVYRVLISVAVAASVFLVVGLGWKLFLGNTVENHVVRNTKKKEDSIMFVVRHEVNTTGKEKAIQLPDGSMILLADKSEVTFNETFINKRDIALNGKAFFKVAKDSTRPFTVTSGEIATTALGTEFTVTAFKNSEHIIVRLYEGKVVIKASKKAKRTMTKDVYLLPGQAFIYGEKATVNVTKFKLNDAAAPEEIMNQELLRDNPSMPESAEVPYFMFNNQSLAQVFDILAKMYQVTIVYDKKDIQNLYLLRRYNTTDSIEKILKEIGTLNNLTVAKKDNTFIISK